METINTRYYLSFINQRIYDNGINTLMRMSCTIIWRNDECGVYKYYIINIQAIINIIKIYCK